MHVEIRFPHIYYHSFLLVTIETSCVALGLPTFERQFNRASRSEIQEFLKTIPLKKRHASLVVIMLQMMITMMILMLMILIDDEISVLYEYEQRVLAFCKMRLMVEATICGSLQHLGIKHSTPQEDAEDAQKRQKKQQTGRVKANNWNPNDHVLAMLQLFK